MRARRKRLGGLIVVLSLVVIAGLWIAQPFFAGAALLMDLAGADGWMRRALPVRLHPIATLDVELPTRHGGVLARIHRPDRVRRTVLVFPGIHAGGLDEPRLATLSARLAATGAIVISVPLPDLRVYRITPASTDVIEDVIHTVASHADLAPSGRVGVIGISFSGGLVIVAAARPRVRDRVSAVISIGGHADLPRVMTYLCTGRLPDGTARPPHDYGVALIVRSAVSRLVPPDQAPAMDAALVAFLDASSYAAIEPERATSLFATARATGERLQEPSRTLLGWVSDRNVTALGPRLLPLVEELGGDPALSPERSPATMAPVFVVHGRDDTVIPSFESSRLVDYLSRQGNPRARALLTPLVTHADVQSDFGLGDAWRLVRFWTAAWSAVD
jgi:acetyl esterase/lipase